MHPKKPNKVRVVFDTSAKYKNDSLNNHLLKGPDLINNLVSILIQFRLGKYAVTADIEQMFHQIKVKKSDQDALRFLWRFLKTEKPQEYAMTVHLFGKNDSPCCSNYALKQCAKDQLQSENVIKCIDNNFYMDDFVKSTSSEKFLLQICQVIIKVLASANFRLHKWITNSSLICETLPRSEVSDKCTNLNEQTIERILGIIWKIKSDTLKVDLVRKTFPPTKRGVLIQLSKIFDPLGILNPCILELKLIVQELWRRKIEWDNIIPKDLLDRFNKFQNGFIYLENIEINRYYGFDSSVETTELHIFADSSNQAYGAVAYIRDVKKDRVNISFVLGKSRLAPLDKNAQIGILLKEN